MLGFQCWKCLHHSHIPGAIIRVILPIKQNSSNMLLAFIRQYWLTEKLVNDSVDLVQQLGRLGWLRWGLNMPHLPPRHQEAYSCKGKVQLSTERDTRNVWLARDVPVCLALKIRSTILLQMLLYKSSVVKTICPHISTLLAPFLLPPHKQSIKKMLFF